MALTQQNKELYSPKVFISYSHDSPEHMDRVLDLSNRLRADGIDCNIDQYETSPHEGWPRWMTNQIGEADSVLVVCTETYERRFRGKEKVGKDLGAKWEGAIVTQELYEAEANNDRFIPVVFSLQDSAHIPIVLRGATYYKLDTEEGYEDLYRRLTNQPRVQKPQLGKLRPMPSLEREGEAKVSSLLGSIRESDIRGVAPAGSTITMVFTDIVGSTEIKTKLPGWDERERDNHYVEHIQKPHHKIIRGCYREHDGREVKTIGDAFFLTFEVASRAVLCAAEIQKRLEKASILTPIGPLKIRIGMHTGSPIDQSGDYIGSSVDKAARVEGLAMRGQVLLSEQTYSLVKDQIKGFGFHSHGDFTLKGLPGLHPIYEALWEGKSPQEIERPFSRPWNVPYPRNKFFTGREDILKRLHDALTSGGTTALTQPQAISGLGGIGKTQTAVEYAYLHRDEYKAVMWAKADSREALVSDFVAIAGLLNLPGKDAQDQSIAVAAVKRWLEDNAGWLLILDNADDPRLVEDFLPSNPKGHILLTSRAQVFDNLGIANPIELDKMLPDETKRFFLNRIGRSSLEAAEIKAIEQLAQELDYLPLALEQAGAYIVKIKCSFQDYLSSYRERGLKLLEKIKPVAGKYPKSVATTWLLNFEQVERTSMAAADLLRFSAFLNPDKIPLELIALGAVELGPVLSAALVNADADPLVLDEVLEPLIQYSLIHRDLSSRTYNIHRLVQAVLRDGMDEATQRQWAERAVRAVNRAFPNVEFSRWGLCERLITHAQVCAELIEKWDFEFEEAARLLNNAGGYLYERARFNEAKPLFERALRIREKALGSDHPNVAASLNNLAGLYNSQGKYAEAEPLYKRALEIDEKALGKDHPDVATDLNNLAGLYRAQGKYAEAEPLYKRALEIMEKALGSDHPDVATSLNNLALLYKAQGKYAEAEPLYKRALRIMEKALGSDHPNVATSLNNLAGLYDSQGKYAEAELLYKRALEIREKALGSDHPNVATILENYAALLRKTKRKAEAAKLEARAKAIRAKHALENPTE
jgi:class 3 adenylate cyclase/tetratricopeptide (TPR) repeat protein